MHRLSRLPFPAVIVRLERALRSPLPGWAAQSPLAPRPRSGIPPRRDPGAGRPASGILLIYPREDVPHLVLTRRSDALASHPGQVGLPGGRVEPGESLERAALRETREEIGVGPDGIRILGALSPVYIPPSDARLHPFVGRMEGMPAFRAHAGEVERLLEIPLAALLDPATRREEDRMFGNVTTTVPYYALEGEKVWGATGMVLAELIAVLDASLGE